MVVPTLSWTLAKGQLVFCGFLCLQSCLWCGYRELHKRSLRRQGRICCADFVCNSLDEAPRPLVQYAYRSSRLGFFIMHCWTATLVVSYLLLIWGIWIAYVIFADLYFPPSTAFWKETFQSWDGVMFPWCVCFVLSHLCLVGVLVFWDAMRSQSMLPADSMAHATHVMVQETVDPNGDTRQKGGESQFWLFRSCFLVAQYLQQLRERQILPVQKSHAKLYVEHMCVRYLYNEKTRSFVIPTQPPPTPRNMHTLLRSGGLTSQEAAERMEDSGLNAIHVRVPGVLESLVMEFSNFYYVFNSVGFLVYIAFTTWNIGLLWFLMTLGAGMYKGLIITRPNQRRVADLAKVKQRCNVLRDRAWQEMDASEIVLGDIVQVKGMGSEVPCDGLLISGSLIMNESMLTGEPMPVAKVSVQDVDSYDIRAKSNKIYAGTTVIESEGSDEHALLFCTDVGALTTRGQLVRMVLFPANVKFKSVDQLPVVYGIMCVYAAVMAILKTLFLNEGSGAVKFLSILCSLIGALSPMLPVSLVMGQSVSAQRLSRSEYQIKCLQPGRIPVAGKISTMVFDKTGTITKSGMDLGSVQPSERAQFQPRVDITKPCHAALPTTLRRALAVCHTVKRLSSDGRLVGNELECAMVRRMGAELGDDVVTTVRELQFDHLSMTSGVVIRRGQVLEAFLKGSPAMIKGRCRASSVPSDYDAVVMQYAKANFYTISICHKILPEMSDQEVNEMPRATLEQDLIFGGLLLFQNEMKLESPQAIAKLKEGAIRSVICTGDSELTGIAIGKQCGIVTGRCFHGHVADGRLVFSDPEGEDGREVDLADAQLALSRSAWLHLADRPELLQQLWPRCVVFGQMKPDDKIHVVKFLQSQDLIVGMAGDGGNDCGALRASHAGIALSKAEASLVAPFSSGRREAQSEEISLMTVPDLLREGRACLATNLATFSYFIVQALSIYGIMTIGMIHCNVVFGEWVYIFKDVFLSMIMTFYMTRSRALPFLAKVRPTATLLGFRTICTISTQVVVNVGFFLVARALMYAQPWYDRLDPVNDIHVLSHMWMLRGDNYDGAITAVCCLASLSDVAYVNTYGGNFRRNICRNLGINVTYFLSMGMVAVLTLAPPNPFNCIFRVNCDTPNSLASGMFPLVDAVSVGGVGECFIGPQVKQWQNYTQGFQQELWLPDVEAKCLPPSRTLDALPLDLVSGRGCRGPNNCFSEDFKWLLMSLIIFQSFIHHFFMKFVLLGPVARRLRKSHRKDVRGAVGFNPICPPKGGGATSKDVELGSPKLKSGPTRDPQDV